VPKGIATILPTIPNIIASIIHATSLGKNPACSCDNQFPVAYGVYCFTGVASKVAPQFSQNFAPTGLSFPHFPQKTILSPY